MKTKKYNSGSSQFIALTILIAVTFVAVNFIYSAYAGEF